MCYSDLPKLPEPQNAEHAAAQALARAADQYECSCSIYTQGGRLTVAVQVATILRQMDDATGRPDVDDEGLWMRFQRADKVRALADRLLSDVFSGDREVGDLTHDVLVDVALHGLDRSDDDRFTLRGDTLRVNVARFQSISAEAIGGQSDG